MTELRSLQQRQSIFIMLLSRTGSSLFISQTRRLVHMEPETDPCRSRSNGLIPDLVHAKYDRCKFKLICDDFGLANLIVCGRED
ncbi:hypothetical protein BDW67DRAFT_111479 [Aspergillus spinulosporus]